MPLNTECDYEDLRHHFLGLREYWDNRDHIDVLETSQHDWGPQMQTNESPVKFLDFGDFSTNFGSENLPWTSPTPDSEESSSSYLCFSEHAPATNSSSTTNTQRAKTKSYRCWKCPNLRDWKSSVALGVHARISQHRPYVCREPACRGKTFLRKDTLVRHESTWHKNRELYVCDRCQRKFRRKDIRTSHQHFCRAKSVPPLSGDVFQQPSIINNMLSANHDVEAIDNLNGDYSHCEAIQYVFRGHDTPCFNGVGQFESCGRQT